MQQVWTTRAPCSRLSSGSVSECTTPLCWNRHTRNGNTKPPVVVLGHANHVDVEKARKDPTIMMGTLPINSVPAYVLFDSGSSDSFVSEAFTLKQDLSFEHMYPPMVVSSPGSKWETSMIAHNNHLEIGGLVFTASLMALKVTTIDVILGMDWLKAHDAHIHCGTKRVQLTHPSGQIVNYSAEMIQHAEGQIYALNASPLEGIKNVPVIRDFPDVFPEELPGIPPARAVEFVIDLKPGTTPIAKRPYKMLPHELLELEEEIDKALQKGFIHPSSSAWQHLLSLLRRRMERTVWSKIIG